MSDKISIVIPAFNQLSYCRECIDSIFAATPPDLYELVLVDNGSTDGVSSYFDGVPGARVIHAPENLGFAGGVNLGLRGVQGHALVLNSDTVTPRGWLERLRDALLSDPAIGMVGPRGNNVSGSQLIPGLQFNTYEEVNSFADKLARDNAGKLRYAARLVGFCMLIRKEVLAQVGLFDDAYGVGNFEDDDYCVRVLRAGYTLAVADDAFVFHYGGRTFSGMGLTDERFAALMAANEALFHQKLKPTAEERSDAVQQARECCRHGEEALARGAVKEAVAVLIDGIKACSVHAPLHTVLAACLAALEQWERAYQQQMVALRLAPGDLAARQNLLEYAAKAGKMDEARAFLADLNA